MMNRRGALDRARELGLVGFQRQIAITLVTPLASLAEQALIELGAAALEPEELAVSIFAELLNPVAADYLEDGEAVIRFGSGGTQLEVRTDLGPAGQIVHVPASYLSVGVRARGNGTLRVRGHVAYATGTRGRPATRTGRVVALAAAGTADVTIPRFATAARIQRSPQTEPYRWDVLAQNVVALGQGLVAAGQGEELLHLPSDAAFVRITNLGVNPIAQARVIFDLGV